MPRPPKGMFRRGSSWYVRLRNNGGDRWMSLGDDYNEACRQLRTMRRAGGQVPERRSVEETAAEWLASYIATARNAKGLGVAKARARLYLVPCLGWKQLAKITADDLRAYRLWLEKKPVARQTVAHVLSDCRCFFRWCEDAGLIERSPVPRKLLPRIQERPPDRLGDEDVAALIGLREPYGFVVRCLLGTGLRWGEFCRAEARDLQAGVLIVAGTKTGKVRRVPVAADLAAEIRMRVGKLSPFSVTSSGAFTRMARRLSGVAHFHPHQLRHTFACRWLESGGSLAALQRILGHSTILTTERYARLSDEFVQAEAQRLAESNGR